jgi:hypothetical protein
MNNLNIIEIKAFVPAKDFLKSIQFYQDIGFTMSSNANGIAYFHLQNASFLLQDFYNEDLAKNFMMHILVEDVESWWKTINTSSIVEKYQTQISPILDQPWMMRDFCFKDPSEILWRIGQNI